MALESMQDLLIHQLQDIYSAEKMLLKALPKMVERVSAEELKAAFSHHLSETQSQVTRLERIFKILDESPSGTKCKAMEGLIAEAEDMLGEDGNDAVIDAGIIADAQRVEHYEIAAYGTARTLAQTLGNTEAAQLLEESLEEEKEADQRLTEIAEAAVNVEASSEEDEEDETSGNGGRSRATAGASSSSRGSSSGGGSRSSKSRNTRTRSRTKAKAGR